MIVPTKHQHLPIPKLPPNANHNTKCYDAILIDPINWDYYYALDNYDGIESIKLILTTEYFLENSAINLIGILKLQFDESEIVWSNIELIIM